MRVEFLREAKGDKSKSKSCALYKLPITPHIYIGKY